LLKKGEVFQACEPIYKAVASLLREAVRRIENTLGEDVGRGWAEAWILHVEGFHERRLSKEDVFFRTQACREACKPCLT